MNIIGISAFYHDSSCCLLRNGELVAAAAEERFSRIKHDAGLPVQAFRFCLARGGLDITDLDALAYYEMPAKKWERQQWSGLTFAPDRDPLHVERALRERLGYEGHILYFEHHRSHAASAFFYSGFEESAILIADGVGEWATTSYGHGQGDAIDLFEEVHFPHSLGLLYATLTAYLGFRVNDGEYKIMGLAPYGKPRFVREIRRLVELGDGGQFCLNLPYFDFIQGKTMYSEQLCALLGAPPRAPESPLTDFHRDVAKSIQLVLEEIVLEKTAWLARRTGSPNLCLAGGVALNGVAMGRIRRESAFKQMFIPPAAGDGGGCLGAAALAYVQLSGRRHSREPLQTTCIGPAFSDEELRHIVAATGLAFLDFEQKEDELYEAVAGRLAQRRVVGWFQGGMEFGPRALGGRSILANPLDPDIRERLNRLVKKRESFRPFAPSVLAEHAAEHFLLRHPTPFMLETCPVVSPLDLPGITHVDGSARPQTVDTRQNPRFAALLAAFYRQTGCPILVNTSFNVRDEPIVCTPTDALFCMIRSGLDTLVLGNFLIDRESLPPDLIELAHGWQNAPRQAFQNARSPLGENLYSFV